jgi:hypothetical protein
LWRTWYVAAAACPVGPAIVASDRFVPWFRAPGLHRSRLALDRKE